MIRQPLEWPDEGVREDGMTKGWSQPGSNLLLDFHGDPCSAGLVVFSDGNHHMALEETLQLFRERHPSVGEIFYATTPPAPIVKLLREGRLRIGNFVLAVNAHLFLSPPHVLDRLAADGLVAEQRPFVKNRGSVLLVRKGNPQRIRGVADLARPGVRLFLSNPHTETVSWQGYVETLRALASREGCDTAFLEADETDDKVLFGQAIHHREAPEAVAAGAADAAMVYYHLALRYLRIFPDRFDMVPLGRNAPDGTPDPANVIGTTHAALVGDGGPWGRIFRDFLFTDSVARIYAGHGLDALF